MELFISTWSFRHDAKSGMFWLDKLIEFAATEGFSGIEIMDRQLQRVPEVEMVRLQKKMTRNNLHWIVDVSSDLTYSNQTAWHEQVHYVRDMIRAAHSVEATKVRILLGGQRLSLQHIFHWLRKGGGESGGADSALKRALRGLLNNRFMGRLSHAIRKSKSTQIADLVAKKSRAIHALHEILPEAERLDVPLAVENHWGLSSDPEVILDIIREIDSPLLGTCPDFDNFPANVEPLTAFAKLAAKAVHVHAKSYAFKPDGEEKTLNYAAFLDRLRAADYDGSIAIEYEGRAEPAAGVLKTRDLILKHWEEQTPT